MKKYFSLLFLAIILFYGQVYAYKLLSKNSRVKNPVGIKLGYYEGLGLDLAFGSVVSFDITTLLYINSAKLRLYLFNENASPFLGVGYGAMITGDNESTSYLLAYGGFEYAAEHFFFQVSIQYPFHGRIRDRLTVIPSLSVGYRF